MAKRKAGKRTASGQLSRSREARDEHKRRAFSDDARQTVWGARLRHKRGSREAHPPGKTLAIAGDNTMGYPIIREIKVAAPEPANTVTKDQVVTHKLDHRGSALGRLWADGKISQQELRAGEEYCARYRAYAALNGLPQPVPTAAAYGAVRGGSRPERLRAAAIAKAEHNADRAILRKCIAGTQWAIQRVCVEDTAAPLFLVKKGLAALVQAGR